MSMVQQAALPTMLQTLCSKYPTMPTTCTCMMHSTAASETVWHARHMHVDHDLQVNMLQPPVVPWKQLCQTAVASCWLTGLIRITWLVCASSLLNNPLKRYIGNRQWTPVHLNIYMGGPVHMCHCPDTMAGCRSIMRHEHDWCRHVTINTLNKWQRPPGTRELFWC